MRRTHWIRSLLCIGLIGTFFAYSLTTRAQIADFTITSLSCSSVSIAYTITVDAPADVLIGVYNANTNVLLAVAVGTDGFGVTNAGSFGFSPTQNGTPIRVEFEYNGSVLGSVVGVCGTNPPSDDDDDGIQPPAPWDDANDGRLNADPAEYYTIYCAFGEIRVYRSTPDTQLLQQIPFSTAENLPVGGSVDLGSFMSMVRSAENTITIYGSNGNLAPEAGSKSFGLRECTGDPGIGYASLIAGAMPEVTPEMTEESPPPDMTEEPPPPADDDYSDVTNPPCMGEGCDFYAICFGLAPGVLVFTPFLFMSWVGRRFRFISSRISRRFKW